ncbi:MAG: DinB family protein [Candidatus Zixiibacteriota bacterium]|nr:MAG: DinB family protein [candidate division Zixibacteria bacterium]
MNLADLFSNYFTVRAEMVQAVKSLSRDQLHWKTPGHPNSIGWLLAHIAETEYWWVIIVAEREVSLAQADWAPFRKELSIEGYISLLEQYEEVTRRWLEKRDDADWDRMFFEIPDRGEKVSLRWLAWHVVEHQARHRGQVFMLMRMQGLEVPHV